MHKSLPKRLTECSATPGILGCYCREWNMHCERAVGLVENLVPFSRIPRTCLSVYSFVRRLQITNSAFLCRGNSMSFFIKAARWLVARFVVCFWLPLSFFLPSLPVISLVFLYSLIIYFLVSRLAYWLFTCSLPFCLFLVSIFLFPRLFFCLSLFSLAHMKCFEEHRTTQ